MSLIEYPDSGGEPMADNTLHFQWIVTIEGGLEYLFHHRPDVFVAGDLLWYPVKGHPEIREAPDAMVAFGRPKGRRGSYRQWEEGGVAPQVVFEVLSPRVQAADLQRKFHFYEQYGVEEYYVYDPDRKTVEGWRRSGQALGEVPEMNGWVSPRLGVRFDMSSGDLQIIRPDGWRFETYLELAAHRTPEQQPATQEWRQAEEARREREQAQRLAEEERREHEQARRAREQVEQRIERLAAQLRALGVDPEAEPPQP